MTMTLVPVILMYLSLKPRLEEKYIEIATEWFEKNYIQTNTSIFQALVTKSGPGHIS